MKVTFYFGCMGRVTRAEASQLPTVSPRGLSGRVSGASTTGKEAIPARLAGFINFRPEFHPAAMEPWRPLSG